jgi:2'-5' RNA ligase
MIKPPPPVVKELRRCTLAFGLDETHKPDHYHATLQPLGESSLWPDARIDSLREALGSIEAEPFAVEFDRLDGTLLRGRKGLRAPGAFQRKLAQRLAARGFALPDYEFWLHLSLAYKGPERRAAIRPIGWLVEDFRLIRSVHGRGHEELGRWPLRRRQLELGLWSAGVEQG